MIPIHPKQENRKTGKTAGFTIFPDSVMVSEVRLGRTKSKSTLGGPRPSHSTSSGPRRKDIAPRFLFSCFPASKMSGTATV